MKLSERFTTITPLSKYLALSLFIILPLITLVIGFRVGEISSVNTVSNTSLSKSDPEPTSLPTPRFTHEFTIKELGIKIKIPEEIANDLIYTYENNAALFSTKSLTKADYGCRASEFPLGILQKVEKDSSRSEIAKNLTQSRIDVGYSETVVGPKAKEFDDFYIEYAGPQSLCSLSPEVGKLISLKRHFFEVAGILASMESLSKTQ